MAEPVPVPSVQDDDLDHQQFLARVLQLQSQVDNRLRRGPAAVAVSASPVYGKGSPLWEKPTEADSDTDPDMPEMIAASPYRPASPVAAKAVFRDDFDDDEDSPCGGSPGESPMQLEGDLGRCWGRGALQNALRGIDPAAGASPSADARKQPF